MNSKTKVYYAIIRDPSSSDRFPIYFRPDCDRTFYDAYGNSESLIEIMDRLDKAGYDLVEDLPHWALVYPHKKPTDINE